MWQFWCWLMLGCAQPLRQRKLLLHNGFVILRSSRCPSLLSSSTPKVATPKSIHPGKHCCVPTYHNYYQFMSGKMKLDFINTSTRLDLILKTVLLFCATWIAQFLYRGISARARFMRMRAQGVVSFAGPASQNATAIRQQVYT